MANWDFIDEHGIPKEGNYIDEDDVLLGKISINTPIKYTREIIS